MWDISGAEYIDCITSAGGMNVGRRNPEVIAALKDALDRYNTGMFLLGSALKAALQAAGFEETALPADERAKPYAECLAEARSWAERLGEPGEGHVGPELACFGELRFFNVG